MSSDVEGVTTESTLAEKIAAAKQLMDEMRKNVVRHGDVVAFVVDEHAPEIPLDVIRWHAADIVVGGKVDERLTSARVNDPERLAIVRALERIDGYGAAKPLPSRLVRLRARDRRQIALDRFVTRRWRESLALSGASMHDGHDRAPRSSSSRSSRSSSTTRDGSPRKDDDPPLRRRRRSDSQALDVVVVDRAGAIA